MSSRSEYYQDVRDIAEEIRSQQLEEGPGGPYDEHSAVHEHVDSSQWVIYTAKAKQVLEFSDNDCAIFDEMGPQEWSDWSTAFSQSAFFAMSQDVYEALAELPEPTWECSWCECDLDERWDNMDDQICLECEDEILRIENGDEYVPDCEPCSDRGCDRRMD